MTGSDAAEQTRSDKVRTGEQDQAQAYEEFQAELGALPGADDFKALFLSYGQRFGFRTVGRWIAGRAPKAKAKAKAGGTRAAAASPAEAPPLAPEPRDPRGGELTGYERSREG